MGESVFNSEFCVLQTIPTQPVTGTAGGASLACLGGWLEGSYPPPPTPALTHTPLRRGGGQRVGMEAGAKRPADGEAKQVRL